jgi:ribosomal protein S18 acetylase RimI-like enzyme
MPAAFLTREFQIEDYDAAVALWDQVEGIEIAEGDSKEELARYLLRNPGLSRIAHLGDRLAGIVLCGHDGRRGLIYHLAIAPPFQRQGLARRLVAECLAGLRKFGITRALILVAQDNKRGRAFWQRTGWEEVGGAVLMGIDL